MSEKIIRQGKVIHLDDLISIGEIESVYQGPFMSMAVGFKITFSYGDTYFKEQDTSEGIKAITLLREDVIRHFNALQSGDVLIHDAELMEFGKSIDYAKNEIGRLNKRVTELYNEKEKYMDLYNKEKNKSLLSKILGR